MSEPAKGTHWSNLISILGVGGKKAAEPPPPTPPVESPPIPIALEAAPPASPSFAATSDPLQIDWGKPTPKKKTPEAKAAPAKKPTSAPGAADKSAPRPAAKPKARHWGSLAEQLGLAPQETDSSVADEPTWIEESEQNGNTLSGDDAADECVSHAGGPTCAPEQCEARSESCAMKTSQSDEAFDTRDTEYLDDVPASDEDLDALADLINEGVPPPPQVARREPRRDEDEEELDRPRDDESRAPRGEGEEGPRRRRRRRGRGRVRRDETLEERRPPRSEGSRDIEPRESEPDDRYDEFDDRLEKRPEDSDEDLDRDLRSLTAEDDSDVVMEGDVRQEGREEGSRDKERRPKRRRRRRRDSEEGSADASRGPRRESEPTDRIRGSDPTYRKKEEFSDLDDEEDGDEPIAMHRNLPTWEDALSAIIASNIENRARSPQQHYGNRGRGGGGRDRGGDRAGGDRGGERGSDRGSDRPDRGGRDRDRGSDRPPPRGRRDDRR